MIYHVNTDLQRVLKELRDNAKNIREAQSDISREMYLARVTQNIDEIEKGIVTKEEV